MDIYEFKENMTPWSRLALAIVKRAVDDNDYEWFKTDYSYNLVELSHLICKLSHERIVEHMELKRRELIIGETDIFDL